MRRSKQDRATDRLNLALARISAAADLIDGAAGDNKQTAAVTLVRKQIGEALDEAHTAVGDIRHVLGAI
jgi:hypothetical protein